MNWSPTPEGLGSVSGAPNLPDGFTGTFTSRYVDTLASYPDAPRGDFAAYPRAGRHRPK